MKNTVSNFITAIRAEQIKKKGTGFYWTSAIMGALSPLLFGIVSIVQDSDEIKSGIPFNAHFKFLENSLLPFGYFFFPLLIIITVSRITQLDHRNGGWQLMETQPMTKLSIYFSKFCTVLIANIIAIASFMLVCVLASVLLTYIVTVPKMATTDIPLAAILHIATRLFIASLFVTSIQFMICVLIPSFIWSILIGFFGLLLTEFLKPFDLVPVWYPYRILYTVADTPKGSDVGHWLLFSDWLSVTASVIVLYTGFCWYRNRRFVTAFFGKASRTVSIVAVLLVFGGLLYWQLQPNRMPESKRTVLNGKIDSDRHFRNAYILDVSIDDTIAVIPFKDNAFHYVFDKPVTADYYQLDLDGKFRRLIYFGHNDSLYIDGKIYAQEPELKVRGTRLAENEMQDKTEFDWSMTEYYIRESVNLDNPDWIPKTLFKEWNEATAKPAKFRSVDNYGPKADFTERTKKLVSVHYLSLWNEFLKKRAALFPDLKTPETAGIRQMKQSLPLSDESLLSSSDYFDYVRSQLILSDKQDIDDNTKALHAILRLKAGVFKDKMLFWQMKKSIEEASNTAERSGLMADYSTRFTGAGYTRRISAVYKLVESLGKGKPAPAFEASTTDGKAVTLASLKGRYVALDIWATWCGPCKQQSPFFEKFALKYKKENITFIAASTDEDTGKWFIEAKARSRSVLQLHLDNPDQFGTDYNVESIPRFILIDPNGNFVNSRLPFPSADTFEMLLRKELGLEEEK